MNNDKNIQPRKRNRADKDPLKGAPGHSIDDQAVSEESQPSIKVRKAGGDSVADENHKAAIPRNVEEALELLGSTFGEANVKKFRELLSSNAANAEAKIKDLMGAISARPVTSAAAVATGVGALFMLREFLTRDSSPKKKVAGSERNPSSKRAMSASKGGKAKSSAKATKKNSKSKAASSKKNKR